MKIVLSIILIICSLATYSLGVAEMVNEQKVIVLLGPPGSGKGTQAKMIAQELNIPHISTGDLFRENMSNQTELGIKAKTYINAGRLVPDEVVLDMLFDRVSREDCKKGFLLDGFPRTIPQAEALDEHLGQIHLVAINLDVADDVVIKRISGRLSCEKCGLAFNIYFSPPKVDSVCDHCGGKLFHRDDDKPEVVKERLHVYNEQTKPLIGYYQKKDELKTLNAEQKPEELYQQILSLMKGM